MFDELRWLMGLNIVVAIWLGMLADSWKGRRMVVWMAIGLVTSAAGLVILALLPKANPPERPVRPKLPSPYSPTDSYGH